MDKIRFSLMPLILVLVAIQALAGQGIKSDISNEWPDNRYEDHRNGTVTDLETGLMWSRCSLGLSGEQCDIGAADTFTWEGAKEAAATTRLAGYDDWRVPTLAELSQLVAQDRFDPSINTVSFPNTPSAGFWTSTPYAYGYYYAWYVYFYYGYDYYNLRDYTCSVRLVRGG